MVNICKHVCVIILDGWMDGWMDGDVVSLDWQKTKRRKATDEPGETWGEEERSKTQLMC